MDGIVGPMWLPSGAKWRQVPKLPRKDVQAPTPTRKCDTCQCCTCEWQRQSTARKCAPVHHRLHTLATGTKAHSSDNSDRPPGQTTTGRCRKSANLDGVRSVRAARKWAVRGFEREWGINGRRCLSPRVRRAGPLTVLLLTINSGCDGLGLVALGVPDVVNAHLLRLLPCAVAPPPQLDGQRSNKRLQMRRLCVLLGGCSHMQLAVT